MGRPSVLIASVDIDNGKTRVRIGGKCVSVLEGSFWLPSSD